MTLRRRQRPRPKEGDGAAAESCAPDPDPVSDSGPADVYRTLAAAGGTLPRVRKVRGDAGGGRGLQGAANGDRRGTERWEWRGVLRCVARPVCPPHPVPLCPPPLPYPTTSPSTPCPTYPPPLIPPYRRVSGSAPPHCPTPWGPTRPPPPPNTPSDRCASRLCPTRAQPRSALCPHAPGKPPPQ